MNLPPSIINDNKFTYVISDQTQYVNPSSQHIVLHFNDPVAYLDFHGKAYGSAILYVNGLLFKTMQMTPGIHTRVFLNIADIINLHTQDKEKAENMRKFLSKGVPDVLQNYSVNLSLMSMVTVNMEECEMTHIVAGTYYKQRDDYTLVSVYNL